jgi:dTDP-4-dehydrorhamnose 3,5-epimerase-like enzyme
MDIPRELSALFTTSHFQNYPKIMIPQVFSDERGLISNIADGKLGDVAVITSTVGSIRANHFHHADWHFSYMVSGSMNYSWKPMDDSSNQQSIIASAGDLIYTPPLVAHKMEFLEESCFIAISALSRNQENYEADTVRLEATHFHA